MDELIRLLEQESHRLERVCYRTTVVVLLVRAEEQRFLGRAVDELRDTVDVLNEAELARAILVSRLADHLGLDDPVTLDELAATAEPEQAARLRAVRDRLRSGLERLDGLVSQGRLGATNRLEAVQRALGRFSGVAAGSRYAPPLLSPPPARFDRSV